MSASRMKNLIILILSLCALGLLCAVVPNRLSQTHEQRQMLQELKTLYESYGLSVELNELPRSPALYSVELSEDGAQTHAADTAGALLLCGTQRDRRAWPLDRNRCPLGRIAKAQVPRRHGDPAQGQIQAADAHERQ